MLDRLSGELFAELAPEDVLHTELAHRLASEDGRTVLRLAIPFSDKGDIRLSKVGAELIVGVGREKRTIILPSALSDRRPAGAKFEDGTLKISFEDGRAATHPPSTVGADDGPERDGSPRTAIRTPLPAPRTGHDAAHLRISPRCSATPSRTCVPVVPDLPLRRRRPRDDLARASRAVQPDPA